MKRLITVKDIEALVKQGGKEMYLDEDTIVTSSARDMARTNNISIKENAKVSDNGEEELDKEIIYKICKEMLDSGMLEGMKNTTHNNIAKFEEERDKSGLKIVRGRTVKMDTLVPENLEIKACYQELVSKEESHISAGFLTINKGRFDWKLDYEEIDYVIEGTLIIEIDGKSYVGLAGDVLYVPSGSKVVWGSPDQARLFYATYPANWQDLL